MGKDKNQIIEELLLETEEKEDSIILSFKELMRQLARYFIIWLVLVVVTASIVFAGVTLMAKSYAKPLTALVGFSYDGIDKGKDPNGDDFDVNTIKAPIVIEKVMTNMGIEPSMLDSIRAEINISGVVPTDAIDEITAYRSIFETNGNIAAVEAIKKVDYFPTSFTVSFNYAKLNMDRTEAADFLNNVLTEYNTYFNQRYGFNDAFGNTMKLVNYTEYDYPQALDVLSTSLSSLNNYIDQLSAIDKTHFRSSVTGYSFSDLSAAISTMRSVDFSSLSSYVYKKNVTRDKEALETYYNYRIDTLTRSQNAAKSKLTAIEDSITNYQKDDILVMNNSDTTTIPKTSESYDKLIAQRTDTVASVADYQRQIDEYKTRLDGLKNQLAGERETKYVEEKLKQLTDKINQLIDDANATADEFFETASFSNAYSILVPASGSVVSALSDAVHNMMRPLLITEALLFVIYIGVSFVRALVVTNQTAEEKAKKEKRKNRKNEKKAEAEAEEEKE